MINDVDESLRAMLDANVVGTANIDIAFDAPTSDWASRRQGPALNVFLYDVREDVERRAVQMESVLDERGLVVGRRTPPRMFKLEYLLTAWAQRPEDEHRMLSAVLDALIVTDAIPAQFLQGRVADAGPIRITTALPLPQERSLSDVWSAMGGSLRPALTLSVTAPVLGRDAAHVGPPVLEGPTISVGDRDGDGPAETVSRRPGQPPADPSGPGEPGDRGEAAREIIDGGRFRRGSRIVELGADDVLPGRRLGMTSIPRPRDR